MDFDVEGQIQLGHAAQIFPQDFFFDFELMLVAGMLVVAAAAAREVGAGGRNAVRGRFEYGVNSSPREAGLLFGESSLDFFRGENKRYEDGFAAWAGFIVGRNGGGSRGLRDDGKTGQAVAAIDQLFDCEEQELILRHEEGRAYSRDLTNAAAFSTNSGNTNRGGDR